MTLNWIQPLILFFVGVTNVKFAGFSIEIAPLSCNWDLSALRPQAGFEHWILQVFSSLVISPHGWTELQVGQRKGMSLPYGCMLELHQTYLLHVTDTIGGEEERSKEKWSMSVWVPNSGSHSRVCGKLAEKSISWIIFDQNRVRRNIFASGAWKCSMTKVIQSQIGTLVNSVTE